MKKYISFIIFLTLCSCGGKKILNEKKPLFEQLVSKTDGGAKIKFFEIISEPQEFMMIKNDPELKKKITANDILTSNFIILNLGEKPTGGYSITIESAVETDKNIVITVKEVNPEAGAMVTQAFSTPYSLVKINSKKEIVFK